MVFFFFSYGQIYELIKYDNWGRHRYLLSFSGTLFLILTVAILRVKSKLPALTRFLNITSMILIIFVLINIASNMLGRPKNHRFASDSEKLLVSENKNLNNEVLPDIYYIIPDGYGSGQVLKDQFNFDNSDFLNFLRGEGFFIADSSQCNYFHTPQSLASSLNMEYVNHLTEIVASTSTDMTILWKMIRDSEVIKLVQQYGYKFVLARSGWGPTDKNKYANVSLKCGSYNEFLKMMTHTTLLCIIGKQLVFLDWYRSKIRKMFEELQNSPSISGPKFVLAHLLSPHPPFIFNSKGESVTPGETGLDLAVWLPKNSYIEQVRFINSQMKKTIKSIKEKSTRPLVIIIQGDHGPTSMDEWDDPSPAFLKERAGILNAYYFSDQIENLNNDLTINYESTNPYSTISPVNSFRIVFNRYFSANLPILADRSFYSNIPTPYDFKNINE